LQMVNRRENVSISPVEGYLVMLLLMDDRIWRQIIVNWGLSEGLSILEWQVSSEMLRSKMRNILVDLVNLLGILLGLVRI
jgi:hypothetical protein